MMVGMGQFVEQHPRLLIGPRNEIFGVRNFNPVRHLGIGAMRLKPLWRGVVGHARGGLVVFVYPNRDFAQIGERPVGDDVADPVELSIQLPQNSIPRRVVDLFASNLDHPAVDSNFLVGGGLGKGRKEHARV